MSSLAVSTLWVCNSYGELAVIYSWGHTMSSPCSGSTFSGNGVLSTRWWDKFVGKAEALGDHWSFHQNFRVLFFVLKFDPLASEWSVSSEFSALSAKAKEPLHKGAGTGRGSRGSCPFALRFAVGVQGGAEGAPSTWNSIMAIIQTVEWKKSLCILML